MTRKEAKQKADNHVGAIYNAGHLGWAFQLCTFDQTASETNYYAREGAARTARKDVRDRIADKYHARGY